VANTGEERLHALVVQAVQEDLAELQRIALGWLEALDLGNEDGVMPHEMSPGKPTTRRYSEAEKERGVRAVRQLRKELGTDHGTVKRVADQLGVGVETLRGWVKQAEIDAGVKPGVTSAEAERVRQLEQENRELRRANEILRRASAFFAAELDRPSK
jgi:transposase